MLRLVALILFCTVPLAAQTDSRPPASAVEISLSFAPVVKSTAPAVVNIYASRVVEERLSPFAGDPFFDQFFSGYGQTQPRMQNSLGSGVIVSGDGIVVSNYHVVGQATEIRVVLNDRREYAADLILGDEESDLAILRLQDAEGLPALDFRNSDEVEVGDLVLAIGNPFGVGQTVSSGIVSGLARSSVELGRGYFIQTDAAINPGNSGGALVDMKGRLVGINTAILTRSGGSNGIGFAIPANLVQTVVAQALAGNSRFARPWAGVQGQAVDAGLAAAMNLPRPDGVLLSDLHPDSPFAAAGLRPGDVVLSIAGEPTNTPQEMIFRLSALGIGGTALVTYLHEDGISTMDVALIAPPESPPRDPVTIAGAVALRGLTVARINPALAAEIALPTDASGVVVTHAQDVAAQVGLRPGDVLLSINGRSIAQPQDVADAATEQTRRWAIDVNRGGQLLRLRFRL
ncbi:trypsin-like peptidase domain-containing protein [Pseudotabrizicola sp.]|uniref:trypsin-like peptidase domain-containing protein n=1 Tax=Pseudotabrizicola sp. TaxID=2939647 RepID=UPI002726CD63|nr:trypsin-like peptidase domain-containing protein [Pseudotabrizicola sp.]MDO8885229.1 trypsin-like peptidase domain-containing protein [Pseudotabrizicola sp.]